LCQVGVLIRKLTLSFHKLAPLIRKLFCLAQVGGAYPQIDSLFPQVSASYPQIYSLFPQVSAYYPQVVLPCASWRRLSAN
jgi:hypothetical protein